MDEIQHELVKMARNFDASPAVTTGMPQDPYFGPKRADTDRNGQVTGMDLFGVRCWGHLYNTVRTLQSKTVWGMTSTCAESKTLG